MASSIASASGPERGSRRGRRRCGREAALGGHTGGAVVVPALTHMLEFACTIRGPPLRSGTAALVQFARLAKSRHRGWSRMIFVDYVLIAILLVSIVIGALRGFLREAVALVSWILALFLAWQFSGRRSSRISAPGSRRIRTCAPGWRARSSSWRCWSIGGMVGRAPRALRAAVDLQRPGPVPRLRVRPACAALVRARAARDPRQLLRMDAEPWWGKSMLMPYGDAHRERPARHRRRALAARIETLRRRREA